MKIKIWTGQTHSGKSSALLQWATAHDAHGIVTPTLHGRKVLLDLATASEFPFEATADDQNTIAVGNYYLHKNAFLQSEIIINRAIEAQPNWIILDEIGKLELQQKGHHQAILRLLQKSQSALLFVVRDYLLTQVMEQYRLAIYKPEIMEYNTDKF